MMFIFLFLAALFAIGDLLLFSNANAAIINAASCSQPNVQAAVNSAANGDTINIPAGECTYSSSVNVSNKSVKIIGAGITQTIIRPNQQWNTPAFFFQCSSVVNNIEVSNIYFLSSAVYNQSGSAGITLRSNCRDYRIHHNRFRNHGRAGIRAWGIGWGVIYENSFENQTMLGLAGGYSGYGVEVVGDGNASWSRWPANPSTIPAENEENVFVEDNTFNICKHPVTGINGGRFVFRHNTVVDNEMDAHQPDMHGLGAWPRGGRAYYIYENSLNTNLSSHYGTIGIRGGDGVIYNNTAPSSGFNTFLRLENERSGPNAQGSNCAYPCLDQIRRLYQWGNIYKGNSNPQAIIYPGHGTIIQKNRDYFENIGAPAGYTAYAYPHPLRGLAPPSVASTLLGGYILRSDPSKIYLKIDDPNGGISVGSATGFSCTVDATPTTITAAECASVSANFASCEISIDDPVTSASQVFLCSYNEGTGNVVDGDTEELTSFTDVTMKNWYAKIWNPEVIISTSGYDSGGEVEHLFDDSLVDPNSMVLTAAAPGVMFVEFDLINAVNISSSIIAGDNEFNYQCETYDVAHKATAGAGYTNVFTGENCNFRTLTPKTFDAPVSDRFWKVTFHDDRGGTSLGLQVFELDAVVSGDVEPPPEPVPLISNRALGSTFFGLKMTP
jgi:hypothetical protein